MNESIDWLTMCGEIVRSQNPVLFVLFLAGLTGSVAHCLTMCTPFVLMQSAQLRDESFMARLLLPYHAGRITTYAVLGAVAGGAFSLLTGFAGFQILTRLMLGAVAMIFLFLLAEGLLSRFGVRLPFRMGFRLPCALKSAGRLMQTRGAVGRYALGLSLGLLPCGLIFAALMTAATTGNAFTGAFAMVAFGLGTVPALMGVGLAGQGVFARWPSLKTIFGMTALGVNAALLLALSLR
ncbi:sulfite exporter TauE/SafE family protein [Asticcacaulis tiandongensis]|uniref:sulfite exporter TauE/SafE family protein n=1 Tax=Asticcacaulis tiandongensis TaxID=2565365 RepID=UPI00112803B6|nr:sulfite exporter TauE/SafE family protein [Asticcacaulis tiandongensis]